MDTPYRKAHWENVFKTKDMTQVSWHQKIPSTSLRSIDNLKLHKTARIIEIGSGDSFIGDYLIDKGFSAITILDISEIALTTIKTGLEKIEPKIKFIATDICQFTATEKYDLWHDRAVFHFITEKRNIERYIQNAAERLKQVAIKL